MGALGPHSRTLTGAARSAHNQPDSAQRDGGKRGRQQHPHTDAFFLLKSDALETENKESQRDRKGNNALFWRDLNRVPLCSSLLRMLRNGGMDYTREAPGGCCPAALDYDRKVRSTKTRTKNCSSLQDPL